MSDSSLDQGCQQKDLNAKNDHIANISLIHVLHARESRACFENLRPTRFYTRTNTDAVFYLRKQHSLFWLKRLEKTSLS